MTENPQENPHINNITYVASTECRATGQTKQDGKTARVTPELDINYWLYVVSKETDHSVRIYMQEYELIIVSIPRYSQIILFDSWGECLPKITLKLRYLGLKGPEKKRYLNRKLDLDLCNQL